jgi:hypothetical protein
MFIGCNIFSGRMQQERRGGFQYCHISAVDPFGVSGVHGNAAIAHLVERKDDRIDIRRKTAEPVDEQRPVLFGGGTGAPRHPFCGKDPLYLPVAFMNEAEGVFGP